MEADTIRVALLDSNHGFTATENTFSQVSGDEISGTGYSANGEALASKAVTQAATTKFDATDVEWTTATFTANHAVIYDDTLAGNDLIASIDFGGAQSVVAGTFSIVWHNDGILTLA
tara:strand:+ start:1048 stop:1398 length:351 start_codon:yes stop_codon:yes gene_type:complete